VVDVTGRSRVRDLVTGKEVEAFVSKGNLSQMTMTSWDNETEGMIRAEMGVGPLQIVMQREPKERALNPQDFALLALPKSNGKTYIPPKDFAVATAIVADKKIENPRKLHALDVTISGIPNKDLIISDDYQTVKNVTSSKGTYQGVYQVRSEEFDASKSLSLPITSTSLQSYLTKVPYLDTENRDIVATAQKIKGDEKNLYKIATAVRAWYRRTPLCYRYFQSSARGLPRLCYPLYRDRPCRRSTHAALRGDCIRGGAFLLPRLGRVLRGQVGGTRPHPLLHQNSRPLCRCHAHQVCTG